jgi:hypothetical protein
MVSDQTLITVYNDYDVPMHNESNSPSGGLFDFSYYADPDNTDNTSSIKLV